MSIELNSQSADPYSQELLQRLYRANAMVADKKPFVIDLGRSVGAFLAIEGSDRVLLDAASQIATVGLGFNHGGMFGAAHHLSTWIDHADPVDFQELERAMSDLLLRHLAVDAGEPTHQVAFCESGSQAIEMALATCFENRLHSDAKRVVAFRGSFHGRTKFALESTWSPVKREPFSWPDQASLFVDYPVMEGDAITAAEVPANWLSIWANDDGESQPAGVDMLRQSGQGDALLLREIDLLLEVRQHLRSRQAFAILIEPMQSEGGDRYSSARFHQGLAALAQRWQVPLVYDEIQTGVHLGRSFFWHRQFEMKDNSGSAWSPDLVVCAKKAQVGAVLSRLPIAESEHRVHAASLARGFAQASLMDQYSDQVLEIEGLVRAQVDALVQQFPNTLSRPRVCGLAFAFELPDKDWIQSLTQRRFEYGLVFYPAGETSLRFRLSLAFGKREIELLFKLIGAAIRQQVEERGGDAASSNNKRETALREVANDVADLVDMESVQSTFATHATLIANRLANLHGGFELTSADVNSFLVEQLRGAGIWDDEMKVWLPTAAEYSRFRDKILQVQVEVYEPARQTPGSDFDRVFATDRPLAVIVEKNDRIVGMAFAGPITHFAHVQGIAGDRWENDNDVAYMVDVTVDRDFRGGFGRILKQGITLLALVRGYRAICGRNRDRLARGMWAINASLGSITKTYLRNSYNDDQPFRDCMYYHAPVAWSAPPICLDNGIAAPFSVSDLTSDFIEKHLPLATGKLTLSNFVDRNFVRNLEAAIELLPENLRHVFTASSCSELTDKLVRALHLIRRPRRKLLTIRGHFFGDRTLLTRALSGIGPPAFDVHHLPDESAAADWSVWKAALQRQLDSDEVLAMFVEPLAIRTMQRLVIERLSEIVQTCRRAQVPIVYNDSAASMYRFSADGFCAANLQEIEPDATLLDLGGQMALAGISLPYFDQTPLQLISTWDGDALSLAKYMSVVTGIQNQKDQFERLLTEFDEAAAAVFHASSANEFLVRRGVGWVNGELPHQLESLFSHRSARKRILPAVGELRRCAEFLRRYSSPVY